MTDNVDELRRRAVFAIATRLIEHGYGFDLLMDYSVSEILGEETCKKLWEKAMKEKDNL